MLQSQTRTKGVAGAGIVAAFGVLTMSTFVMDRSLTTINDSPKYCYEAYDNKIHLCNSSLFLKQAVGDIVPIGKKENFMEKCERVMVDLEITKITRHVSNFEFEEEYEEI